ncbi:hypothetical protein DRE_00135 [Drechslerella stenobrocha 248]|uniref:B30.2/SPRY domain-containing protein n=1 Tax=Drechslerella stenobrocha 248 TaxID=1043628 RepID=W7IHS7_9PEZI|nr:hypothetical protein DRE_00135 [Drechslerella stenobrocha 248]
MASPENGKPNNLPGQTMVQASPCWARGKEIFLALLLQQRKPPSKSEIDTFMKQNAHLDSTIESCTNLQKSADSSYHGKPSGRLLRRLLSTLSVIKQVADPFLESAPESISIAWFALSCMIQIGAADIENCEIIFRACNEIANVLLTCRLYERRYQDPPQSGHSNGQELGSREIEEKIIGEIPGVIASILDFSWYVHLMLKENKFLRAIKETVSPKLREKIEKIETGYAGLRLIANDAFQERVMDSVEDLRKNLQQDKEELQSLIFPALDEIASKFNEISEIKASVDQSKLREDFRKMRADLRPSDVHSNQFAAVFDPVSRYADHICQWLFMDPIYKVWEQEDGAEKEIVGDEVDEGNPDEVPPPEPRLFYVQARPGFGKSVVLASVVHRLSKDPTSIVSYFFFKQGDDATQRCLRALASLATQLFDDKHARTEEELMKLAMVMEQMRSVAVSDQASSTSSVVFTADMLKAAIMGVASAVKKRIYLIVDGIDECVDHEVESLVPYLTELGQMNSFRVMISSRENEELLDFFSHEPDDNRPPDSEYGSDMGLHRPSSFATDRAMVLNITEARTSADMGVYLETSLQRIMAHRSVGNQSKRQADKETARIVRSIKQKANGMFTYAGIVIASLEQPSQLTLAQKLKNLPHGMDELYRQRLEELSFEEKKLILTALKFLVWGTGSITTGEIAEHFKNVYEDNTSEEAEESQGQTEDEESDEESLDSVTDHPAEGPYDPMNDPEIAETVYHLTKSGRDFFKFSNNLRNIDVVHKTVRDWVENEAEKISEWQQTVEASRPRISITSNGELSLTLRVPQSYASTFSWPYEWYELQAERDAQLDLTISMLTALCNPQFVNRYLRPCLVNENDKQGQDESISSGEFNDGSPAHPKRSFSLEAYEEKKKTFRYEVRYLLLHLSYLEVIWPEKDRESPKWTKLWDLLIKFVESESYTLWAAQHLQIVEGYPEQESQILSHKLKPGHVFASEGLNMVLEYLLSKGKVDLNLQDHTGKTPFILAIHNGFTTPTTIAALMENGVDINGTYDGETYWWHILEKIWVQGWMKNKIPPAPASVAISKLFIKAGVDINQHIPLLGEGNTATAIHVAVSSKSIDLFETLLEHPDIDIHAQDRQGMTALNWVTWSMNPDYPLDISKKMTKALLEAGADPNHQDVNSGGPLLHAVIMQDKDCVELLLQHGADVNDDNNQGLTAIHVASSSTSNAKRGSETAESIMRLLLMYGADFEKETTNGEPALLRAAWRGYDKVFMILINEYQKKYGPDKSFLLKKFGKSSATYLQKAAQNPICGLTIIKYLVQQWTPEQLQDMLHTTNESGENALHLAARYGIVEIARFLIGLGVDVNVKSTIGSALNQAFICWGRSKLETKTYTEEALQDQKGLESTCFFLLDKAPHLAKNEQEYSIYSAIQRYHEELITKLVECGYDLEQVDESGWSTFEFAYAERRLDSMRKLPVFSAWKHTPDRMPRETSVPSRLKHGDSPNIFVLAADGISFETCEGFVEYDRSGAKLYSQERQSLLVTADYPIAAHRPVFYWEVTLEEVEPMFKGNFMIGFVTWGCLKMFPPGSPQLEGDTYSLSDKGSLISSNEARIKTFITRQGPIQFGNGDTIGCGYSIEAGVIFYTLNGKYLGTAFDSVRGRLHPAIGSFAKCKGKVNFGAEPFRFEEMREG